MFTVCPKCALTLVVTAADLRVAQGYVRCGRCSSVFNALARLTEERGGASLPAAEAVAAVERAAAQAEATAATAQEPAAEVAAPIEEAAAAQSFAEEESPPDEALEFNPATTDVNSVFVQPAPDPQWTAATGSFKALMAANDEPAPEEPVPGGPVDVEIDAAFFAAMLSAESPPKISQPVPGAEPAARSEPPTPAVRPARPAPRAAAPARAVPAATIPLRRAPAPVFDRADADGDGLTLKEESFEESPGAPEPDDDAETQSAAQLSPLARLREHGWSVGALLALLLLGAQVVNHERDELAASARFNRPLTALYGRLGVKLFPHWDLHAYDVRQLGASAETTAPALITVRASIKNGANQPQPLPLLRVTLQDRFGNRIAMRDVAPRSYLPATIPASSFLAAGQRIDAELDFADPGAEAVGFEIDACLPARGGVSCANDAALR
jgi:predicted Zn finger-like uncharacterized protein